MGMRIAEAVVIQDLQEFRFFEGRDRLPRLVVVHKNDLEARRVEQIALAGNFGTLVFAASLQGAPIIARTVVSPGWGPRISVKYLNRLKPLIIPYGLPSSSTTGAIPP